MGLKKNNPGCGCCSPCLQQDATEFTGVEVSGIPAHSFDYNGNLFTYPDFNGVYLWSASINHRAGQTCGAVPSDWRLGASLPTTSGCCRLDWTQTENEGPFESDGMAWVGTYQNTAFPYNFDQCETLQIYVKATYQFSLSLTIANASIAYSASVSTTLCAYYNSTRQGAYYQQNDDPNLYLDGCESDPDKLVTGVNIPRGINGSCTLAGGISYAYTVSGSHVNTSGLVTNPVTYSAGTSSTSTDNSRTLKKYRASGLFGLIETSSVSFAVTTTKAAGTIQLELV